MITDVNDYFEVNSRFDIFDPFGIGRLREAEFKFDNYRFEKNRQIENYKKTVERQAQIIRTLTMELEKTKSSNMELIKKFDQVNEQNSEYVKHIAILESAKVNSTKALEQTIEQNILLKMQLQSSRTDYEELSEVHEKLCEIIQKERPDILLDSVYSNKSAS